MADLSGYDANEHDPMSRSNTLPLGWYIAIIVKSTMKVTKKDENNSYLELEMKIVDGPYSGMYLWDKFNLKHKKPEVVIKAKRLFSAVCRSVNIMKPPSSEALHNIPFRIKVRNERNSVTGKIDNVVEEYARLMSGHSRVQMPVSNEPESPPLNQQQPQATQTPASGETYQNQPQQYQNSSPHAYQRPEVPQEHYDPNQKPWDNQ